MAMSASRLRLTGGTARGLPITEPRGVRLRPTSGLVREAIFNILGDGVDGARVLDLYAGTGALGIESLSRGSREAVFIDSEAGCCQSILETLARAGFSSSAKVLRGRLPGALQSLEGQFNVIFMDPPYNADNAEEVLFALGPWLTPDGIVVYEHGSRYNPPERGAGLRRIERRLYGDSALAQYVHQEGE
jgi:16S rRNA (guanine(966)-N(2))-methyltransferase RsmD